MSGESSRDIRGLPTIDTTDTQTHNWESQTPHTEHSDYEWRASESWHRVVREQVAWLPFAVPCVFLVRPKLRELSAYLLQG